MKIFLPLLAVLTLSAPFVRAQPTSEECVDTWPKDRERPKFAEEFPTSALSGHVATLTIKVQHLKGERVFPAGLVFSADSNELEWLKKASFRIPDATSDVRARLERKEDGQKAVTTIALPLIPLSPEAGRKELVLPRLPVAVARASGQVHTICTEPHVVLVDDPLASVPNPKAKPDPDPRPQIEVWTALRDIVLTLLWALPLAIVLAWLLMRFRRRLKKEPPPPPPRPPWETALSQLRSIEEAGLFEHHEYEEYLDRVSDTLREYLGQRYGFDGLESTTRELLRQMASKAPDFEDEKKVRTILQRTDLVKFARRLPTEEECKEAFEQTREMVRKTTPVSSTDPQKSKEGRPSK